MPRKASIKTLKKKAWDLLSELVRRGNANESGLCRCYTCGAMDHWENLHAGHAIPGRKNGVLLDERIIRPQDSACNVFGGGRYEVFSAKLMIENGWTPEEWLDLVAELKRPKKVTRGDYEALITSYKERLKELEHG